MPHDRLPASPPFARALSDWDDSSARSRHPCLCPSPRAHTSTSDKTARRSIQSADQALVPRGWRRSKTPCFLLNESAADVFRSLSYLASLNSRHQWLATIHRQNGSVAASGAVRSPKSLERTQLLRQSSEWSRSEVLCASLSVPEYFAHHAGSE